ncbi:hypothetical protein Bhyg_12948 [Pseudolycoriella hygida]|uniref:Chitin-binding type-4 domain-containing protein n=1 Tax=Pseudolycoriella hygida TaxID=35572 RepID=A0A9Q0MZ90_9DIPT|nr:hypothetical protein Bhyg_12948 [Pseudolycoriella hygida]
MNVIFASILLIAGLTSVEPHGYLKSPLARTSIFREPRFNTTMPYWWDDTGVWCGNDPQDLQYSTCGRCGDAQRGTTANQGGYYDKGVITATYESGSRITVTVDITAAHYGFFALELCPQQFETDGCFEKLSIFSGSRIRRKGTICVGIDSQEITANVQLPAGVTCKRCTLRWTYRTSYGEVQGDPDWDPCFNRKPAQTFRNCADIEIK